MNLNKKIIYLTGFMGAGKSTIGPILANTLGWAFFDLDKVIEEKLGKKITDIFAQEGEEYFRTKETEILKEISNGTSTIISLGGGTVIFNNNLEFVKSNGVLIYLKTSPEVVYKRLFYKRDRPNLSVEEDDENAKKAFLEKIKKLYDERRKYYEQADFIITTEKAPVGSTVDRIASIINKRIPENE